MNKRILLIILFLASIGSFFTTVDSHAQEDVTGWSVSQRIPGVERSPHTRPHLIADRNRTVHFFNSQYTVEQMLIVYSKWTLADGWTIPVDILVPIRGQARILGVHLDDEGTFHLVFFSGNDQSASIYYSKAHISQAGKASRWSEPLLIGEAAITPTAGVVLGDGSGKVVVVYSGKLLGNGLYEVHTVDGGQNWSEPFAVYLTNASTLWPWSPDGFINSLSEAHLVWSVVNIQGNGEAVDYSQFDFDTFIWREPTVIARAIRYEANSPVIIELNSDLLAIYHNDFVTTRWMQWSRDDGTTWDPPERLFTRFEGSNGPVSLVLDSAGTLHMLFGNRTTNNNPGIHGLWHSVWDGKGWSEPVPVVSGIANQDSRPGGEAFDPWYARAVVSQGNILLVTWSQDPSAGSNGIWFSYKELDTPEWEIAPFPTPRATPSNEPTPTEEPRIQVPTSTIMPTKAVDLPTTAPQPTRSLFLYIALALVPSLVLVAGVVAYQVYQRNR